MAQFHTLLLASLFSNLASPEKTCGESLNKHQTMHKLSFCLVLDKGFLLGCIPAVRWFPLCLFSLCVDCSYSSHIDSIAKVIHHSYPSRASLMLLPFRQQDMGRNTKYKKTLFSQGKKKLKINGHCVILVFSVPGIIPYCLVQRKLSDLYS